MANLIETATYDAAVPQLETNTMAIGGPGGVMNAQAQALANRTKYLKDTIDAMGDAGLQAVKEIGAAPASTTGGKLVNKITEAGYSLAPATGTSNLDNIADGTSYKRVQAAKADAINGGTFDAASVLAFGIGAPEKDLGSGANLNNIQYTGFFRVQSPVTTMPSVSEIYWRIINIYEAVYNATQIAFTKTVSIPHIYIRKNVSGTWSDWYEIWNASSDGNGGRPPIGKGEWLAGAPSNVNTWTDFITLPNVWAKYLFLAREPGGYYTYFASAILSVSNGAIAMINYACANTINLQIRIGSGLTLQVYQNAGNGAVMQYALIPLTA